MSESTKESDAPEAKKLKLNESVVESKEAKDKVKSRNKYEKYNRPEELEMLKEFQVLDEVKSNDKDSNDNDSYSSNAKSKELPEDGIEKMLAEDLPKGFKGVPKPNEKAFVKGQKIVLEEKGGNHFEVLPFGWLKIRHFSGMPVYLHRTSRVCTLSKPFSLGKGNTRRHDIPISSIPCLSYRRALEEEEKQQVIDQNIEDQIKNHTLKNSKPEIGERSKSPIASTSKEARDKKVIKSEKVNDVDTKMADLMKNNAVNDEGNNVVDKSSTSLMETDETETKQEEAAIKDVNMAVEETSTSENVTNVVKEVTVPRNRQPVVLPGGIVMPPPRVESISTSWKTQHLTHEQVNEYCKRLFKFKTVNIKHFM